MSEPKNYMIVTIADAFRLIPEDKVDAFLKDLGGMMKYHKRVEACLSALAKAEIKTSLENGFLWIDDGRSDISLRFGGKFTELDQPSPSPVIPLWRERSSCRSAARLREIDDCVAEIIRDCEER